VANNPKFKEAVDRGEINRTALRNYYGLKASVAFSYGSHDEWNIIKAVNERRRGADRFGIANQLPVFFDGDAAAPASFEVRSRSATQDICAKRPKPALPLLVYAPAVSYCAGSVS
jgi:hypothetical protein